VNKELATLKSEISELRTEFNTTIQKVEDLSANPEKATTIENKTVNKELATLKSDISQLKTDVNTTIQKVIDEDIEEKLEAHMLQDMRNTIPPENDSFVLISTFKGKLESLDIPTVKTDISHLRTKQSSKITGTLRPGSPNIQADLISSTCNWQICSIPYKTPTPYW
jgi:seryl-tRNA synthetase